MNTTIDCPNCHTKIEIDKAITAQFTEPIRKELQADVNARKAALDKQASEVANQRAANEKAAAEIAEKVQAGVDAGVNAARAALMADARKKAEDALAVQLRERDEHVSELQGKLKVAQDTELALRKRERELEEKSANVDLEVSRRVSEQADRLRDEAQKKAAEEFSLKEKQSQDEVAALRQRIEQLKSLEAGISAREEAMRLQAMEMAAQREALATAQSEVSQKIKAGIEAERATLQAQIRLKVREDLAVEIRERDERVTDLETKLKAAQTTELALRKRERELQEKSDNLDLEVARRIKEETDRARDAAKKQAAEEHLLKDKENQEQNTALRRQVEDLKRKLEQGSQQAQGEALELIVEDVLARAFPLDEIKPIAKGVHGADILQQVMEASGLECGSILWETKNATKWAPKWLTKLREDQRREKAAIAVLVTEAMPEGTQHLTEIEGVWICTRACAVMVGAALRAGLVELAKSRQAADGKHGKIERVYDYLTSPEFRQRVAGVVDPLVQLQNGLNRERRSMERIWSAREKQIQSAVVNMHGMYGDLQGIVGATLKTLEQMDLLQLEASPDGADAV